MRISRRRAAWAAILGAGAALGFAAPQWKEIAVRWRLAELEQEGSEAELPAELVGAAPGTVEGEVFTRYVRTPTGKDRLLRSYLAHVERSLKAMSGPAPRVGWRGKTAVLLVWMGPPREYAMIAWVREPPPPGWVLPRKPGPIQVAPGDLELWWSFEPGYSSTRLQDLVLEIGYEEYPVPGRPGARFSVVSHTGAEKPCSRSFSWIFPRSDYACLIESEPYRLDLSPGSGR